VLSDYLDKSTRITLFTVLGGILLVIPVSIYLSMFLEPLPSFQGLVAIFTTMYLSMIFIYYATRLRKRNKKNVDKYLEMISQETLLSYSEYEKLLTSLRNELAHSVEETVREKRVSPTKEEIERRKKELKAIENEISYYEQRKADLQEQLKTFQRSIAKAQRELYDLEKATKEKTLLEWFMKKRREESKKEGE